MGLRFTGTPTPGSAQNQEQQIGLEEAQKQKIISGLGQAAAQTGGQAPTMQQTEQAGLTAQEELGQQQATMRGQQLQQTAQTQQMQLQTIKLQKVKQLTEKRQQLTEKTRTQEAQLFNINSSLKQSLVDETIKFQKDEMGRTLFNEHQLADWAVLQAKTQEDLLNFEQQITQETTRQLQILETAQKRIIMEMQQEWAKGEQEADQELRMGLAKAKQAMDEKIARAKKKSARRGAIFSAVGSIVGAVAGTIAGIPAGPAGMAAGAMAGQQIGAAGGQMVHGMTED